MQVHDDTSATAESARRVEVLASAGEVGQSEDDHDCAEDESVSPASFAQQRFWFFDRLTGGVDVSYNIPIALRLAGVLDKSAMARAALELVERHEVLRTRFAMRGDRVVQITSPSPTIDFSVISTAPDALASTLQRLERHRFDLAAGPLIRMVLLEMNDRLHVLSINVHHAVCDGWSIAILVDELCALYEAACGGVAAPPAALPLQYGDFSAWQRHAFDSGTMQAQLDHWMRVLTGAPPLLQLPSDRPRPVRKTLDGARVVLRIDQGPAEGIARLAARHGATPFMVYLAAFHVLLRRLSGQADTLIGTPIGSRSRVELEPLIGCFVNTVVLRLASDDHTSLRDLLREVKRVSIDAFAHQDLPFEALVEAMRPARTLSHTPIFQVLFAYQNAPKWQRPAGELETSILPQTFDFGVSRFDLTLNISERDSGTIGYFEYSTDLFDAGTIESHAQSYLALLDAFARADVSDSLDVPLSEVASISSMPDAGAPSPAQKQVYWREKLRNPLPVLELPAERKTARGEASRSRADMAFTFPPALANVCRHAAKAARTEPAVVLLAAYMLLLRRIARQTDVLVVATFGTDAPNILRLDVEGPGGFRALVDRVRDGVREASRHAVALDTLMALVSPDTDQSRHPAFGAGFEMASGEPEIRPMRLALERDEIHLRVHESEGRICACFHLALATHTVGRTMDALPQLFASLLGHALDSPRADPLGLPLLAAAERQRIVELARGSEPMEVPYRTLAEPFEAQVRRTPHAVALVGEAGEMSYLELDQAANRLARCMQRQGVVTGSVVAVCMERSFGMVVGLYAVAKLGAAYVPIDPDQPVQRLQFMLEESGTALVLAHQATHGSIPGGPWQVLDLDEVRQELADESPEPVSSDLPRNGLAYLMYTSGSTGRPKAVAYPVDAVLLCTFWLQRHYPIGEGEAHLFKTPFAFDVSTWEVFWSLYFGGRLVVCLPGGHRDPRYLLDLIEEHEVVSANFVPTMLQAFLDELPSQGRCPSLRWILCGGEPLTPRLRESFFGVRLACKLVNLAGATETHTVVHTEITPRPGDAYVPLGRPAADYRLYVLDENLEPVPPGVVGEWYIAGRIGLAHGYHARPALTAEKFLPDPFGPPGQRMYRTGDLCRCADDGTLEHLGREDSQIKVRGLRVDLAEIEQVLGEHAQVHTCLVVPFGSEASDVRIVAFVVRGAQATAEVADLMAHCRTRLPRGMLPSAIVDVECIPATHNGKVDHQALASAWAAAPTTPGECVPPQTATEERLKDVFEQVLGLERLSVTTSFFDLGGHSLLAFKLTAACEHAFGVQVPIVEVFSRSSVRELAAWIDLFDAAKPELCVVPLAASPDKPLLVCIHAASGTVLPFVPLAAAMAKDFSVVGLQVPFADGSCELLQSLESYAERYVEAVDAMRGDRPVMLLGWSMGGNIAVEMTRRWQQMGNAPAHAVVLLDATATGVSGDAGMSRLKHEEDTAHREIAGLEQVLGGETLPTRSAQGLRRLLEWNVAMFRKAPAPPWLDAEVDLLVADGTASILQPAEVDLGWRTHVRELRVDTIGGTHFDLLSSPYVPALAATLRAIAERRR